MRLDSAAADAYGPFGMTQLLLDVYTACVAWSDDDGLRGGDALHRKDADPIPADDFVADSLSLAINQSTVSEGTATRRSGVEIAVRGVDRSGEADARHAVALRATGAMRPCVPAHTAAGRAEHGQSDHAGDQLSSHAVSMKPSVVNHARCG
jgi:hypothetical protein